MSLSSKPTSRAPSKSSAHGLRQAAVRLKGAAGYAVGSAQFTVEFPEITMRVVLEAARIIPANTEIRNLFPRKSGSRLRGLEDIVLIVSRPIEPKVWETLPIILSPGLFLKAIRKALPPAVKAHEPHVSWAETIGYHPARAAEGFAVSLTVSSDKEDDSGEFIPF